MDHSLFYQLTSVLLMAGLIALLVSLLKQPSVMAFIVTGIIVGSFGYAQLHSASVFFDLGEVGITLLLFMVGLELDVGRLKELGSVVLTTSAGQIAISSVAGFFLARLLGFAPLASFYVAIALTFSSTIIVVKLLGEKRELQTLHGRIVVGCSIIQDFAALLILLFLGGSTNLPALVSDLPGWQILIITLVKALIFFLLLALVSKKVLPWLLRYLGKSDELLLSFSLAWALGLAAFAALPWVGFNFEIGGFLAGLALANSQVHWEIAARIKSIRDFFIIIFFIVFGSQLAFGNITKILPAALVLSCYMLIINPLIVMWLLGWQGYKPKTAFKVGMGVVPMSEFSLILVALGSRVGQISQPVVSLITLVGLISIGSSSYLIMYSDRVYQWSRPLLQIFDWGSGDAEKTQRDVVLRHHVVLAGAHRLGKHLISSLEKLPEALVIVDINPEIVAEFARAGFLAICGDITESYIQDQINLTEAKVIISTIPSFQDNLALLEAVKRTTAGKRTKPKLIFVAQNEAEAKQLYEQEIDYALSPHFIGGQHLAKILQGKAMFADLKKLKADHLKIIGG